MGRAKPVQINIDLQFSTMAKATEHFKLLLDENRSKVDTPLDAEDRKHVHALHLEYCKVTGHKEPADNAEYVVMHKRDETNKGGFVTTQCFAMRTSNGGLQDFSYGKAITAIANKKP